MNTSTKTIANVVVIANTNGDVSFELPTGMTRKGFSTWRKKYANKIDSFIDKVTGRPHGIPAIHDAHPADVVESIDAMLTAEEDFFPVSFDKVDDHAYTIGMFYYGEDMTAYRTAFVLTNDIYVLDEDGSLYGIYGRQNRTN